jgi:hypothetical protein
LGLLFRRATGPFDFLVFVGAALGVVTVGLSYYSFRRVLSGLEGSIDEKALFRLLVAANSMATGGYMSCVMAVMLLEHR